MFDQTTPSALGAERRGGELEFEAAIVNIPTWPYDQGAVGCGRKLEQVNDRV